ncbi:MAG: hypothetical protein H0V55_05575 [Thermoleophilaceae bacterium]|jgi:adenylosuccinate lyase|nr:hypothetical protein [Thermoleophilaceae bacterium]
MEAVLIVLGAIAGALATGAIGTYDTWHQRRLQRTVASRVILGDLYVLDAVIEVIERGGRWPDRFDWQAPLET